MNVPERHVGEAPGKILRRDFPERAHKDGAFSVTG